jgi:hypothetical protein
MDNTLDEDIIALEHEAQKAVDREIAARVELDAAINNRVAVRAKLSEGSARAIAFIDQYVNPTEPNPEPIVPEVAQPAPAEEPPVFTTVDTGDISPDNSTGGESEVAEELELVTV